MRESHGAQERFLHRHRLWIRLFLGGVFLLLLVILYSSFKPRSLLLRETILLVDNPMVLWSRNTRDQSVVLIALPSDTVIDAVHGYGVYSFDALWKLGEIDKKERNLLRLSMQEYLGIPIQWYMGRKNDALDASPRDPKEIVRSLLSVSNIGSYMMRQLHTNVPITIYGSFIKSFLLSTPDKITTYDLKNQSVIQDETIADGTSVKRLNINRFDEIIGHTLDDDEIRNERVSVAIYNTTNMPSVGQRIARLLGHMGIFVITVGNDSPEITDCTVTASKDVLRTKTAGFIRSLYHCKDQEEDATVRADLILRMGSLYAESLRSKTIHSY